MSELDRKAKLVLEAIYEQGGEASTKEIKSYTGINKNGIIHYRFDKLDEAGLIEKRLVDTDGSLPVTIASLTPDGEDSVGEILDESGGPTLEERVTVMAERVATFDARLASIEGRLEDSEDLSDEVQELKDEKEQLRGCIVDILETQDIYMDGFELGVDRLPSVEEYFTPDELPVSSDTVFTTRPE